MLFVTGFRWTTAFTNITSRKNTFFLDLCSAQAFPVAIIPHYYEEIGKSYMVVTLSIFNGEKFRNNVLFVIFADEDDGHICF